MTIADRTLLALALLALPACGAAPEVTLRVERDTVGDTLVVRTVAGSAWGAPARLEPEVRIGTFEGEDEYMLGDVAGIAVAPDGAIYLYDRQVPALRKYAPDGTYVATFGREGGGPGEYENSDGGLAVLPDGRVLLRDPGAGRILVYGPDGASLGQWPLRGGYFTSRPIYTDTAGGVYSMIWGRRADGSSYRGLRRYGPEGEPTDSMLAPEWGHEAPTLSFSTENMVMTNHVPFSPTAGWTFSPFGYYVGGVSDRYSVTLFRTADPVLRIERRTDPVPVDPDEKADRYERATANFRRLSADWKWNGPEIPDVKPAFQRLSVAGDGRVWVQVSVPGERIPADELALSDDPAAPPPERWREPVVWDVFEPDGTYLGPVHAPQGLRTSPEPVFRGDHVWAVVTDALDVEYVTRFRIVREQGAGD